MGGRPTIKIIEPYMYVIYMLVLSDNISPNRALEMAKDEDKFYNEERNYVSRSGYIRSRIEEHLITFWNAQGKNGLKRMSTLNETLLFIEKYKTGRSIWARAKRWFRRN